jgi:hypothetical protein
MVLPLLWRSVLEPPWLERRRAVTQVLRLAELFFVEFFGGNRTSASRPADLLVVGLRRAFILIHLYLRK